MKIANVAVLGLLAAISSTFVVMAQDCTSDDDCLADNLPADGVANYCAGGTCRPVGGCSTVDDCKNPSNGPFAVAACVGYLTCNDESLCQQVCSNEECADGVTFRACDADALPCDQEDISDACPEAVSCVNDPCSGGDSCSALYFDEGGSVVCPTPANLAEDVDQDGDDNMDASNATLPVCESDDQCDEDAYCAGGDCLPVGSCYTTLDCTNESNGPYAVVACVGPLVCSVPDGETVGVCGIPDCNGFLCADESEPQDGCEECDVSLCPDAVSCWVDSCGGACTSVYYGADGSQVCQPADASTSCAADSDCLAEFEYCLAGTCVEGGTCGDLADCFNPSNLYAVALCVGPLVCEGNLCGIPDCNGQFCSDGAEPQEDCPPCDVSSCPEAVSCAVSNCGACNNHFFDAAGNQVCLPTTVPSTDDMGESAMLPACTTDADCNIATAEARQGNATLPEFYCGQGVCQKMGSCGSVLDCNNPSNIFAMIECVGYMYCLSNFNICGVECGSGCEDGSQWQSCDPLPCEDPAQSCPGAASCYNDVCNGCKAVYLDAAGKNITADCPIAETFDNSMATGQENDSEEQMTTGQDSDDEEQMASAQGNDGNGTVMTVQNNGDGEDSPASVASVIFSFVAVVATVSALFL